MPLLTSPIDGAPMRQINRYGIEFDICPTTGGVWLDKGELEKLIALIQEESQNEDREQSRKPRYRSDEDDDYEEHRGRSRRRSRLTDLFDF